MVLKYSIVFPGREVDSHKLLYPFRKPTAYNIAMRYRALVITASDVCLMYLSRQKPRLEVAKVFPRPRLDDLMARIGLDSASML